MVVVLLAFLGNAVMSGGASTYSPNLGVTSSVVLWSCLSSFLTFFFFFSSRAFKCNFLFFLSVLESIMEVLI